MYQLSTPYSVNESSSLFTITFSEIQNSESEIVVTLRNESQEEFIRHSLSEPIYLVRHATYNRETGETTPDSEWSPIKREAFRFLDRRGNEIRGFAASSILKKFAASPARHRNR